MKNTRFSREILQRSPTRHGRGRFLKKGWQSLEDFTGKSECFFRGVCARWRPLAHSIETRVGGTYFEVTYALPGGSAIKSQRSVAGLCRGASCTPKSHEAPGKTAGWMRFVFIDSPRPR